MGYLFPHATDCLVECLTEERLDVVLAGVVKKGGGLAITDLLAALVDEVDPDGGDGEIALCFGAGLSHQNKVALGAGLLSPERDNLFGRLADPEPTPVDFHRLRGGEERYENENNQSLTHVILLDHS